MFLTDSLAAADKVRKWSTQSREAAPWYQHEEIGFNYRMSNVIAGVVRGQIPYLEEHISQKRAIYKRYKEGLADLPVSMNPYDAENSVPNFWLNCILINSSAMCKQIRGERETLYLPEHGKSCPTEVLNWIASINAEGRPIWKPMHMQPIYRMNSFIIRSGNGRARSNAYIDKGENSDISLDIFNQFGKHLRNTSLDELPELFNIVKGDMAVIGPRPQLVRDMVFMTIEQKGRHTVRPGLSGLAQVKGRNEISWEEKLEWDLKYIENGISFSNDVGIVLETFKKIRTQEGITDGENATAVDYGDVLLKEKKITEEQYERGQLKAKKLLEKFR